MILSLNSSTILLRAYRILKLQSAECRIMPGCFLSCGAYLSGQVWILYTKGIPSQPPVLSLHVSDEVFKGFFCILLTFGTLYWIVCLPVTFFYVPFYSAVRKVNCWISENGKCSTEWTNCCLFLNFSTVRILLVNSRCALSLYSILQKAFCSSQQTISEILSISEQLLRVCVCVWIVSEGRY